MAIDWGNMGSGLLSAGAGLWEANAQKKADEKRLQEARGPVYQQAQTGAMNEMASAGATTPEQIMAQQQALLAPQQAKQEADTMRQLYAKGLLGVSNYSGGTAGGNGLPGGQALQQPGQPGAMKMNPHMAAMYAARENANANLAANSQTQASNLRSAAITRAGDLNTIASNQQTSGLQPYAKGSGVSSAGKSSLPGMISGIGGLLKDSGAMKGISDWINNLGGTVQTAGADMSNPYGYTSPSLRQDDYSGGYY